MSSCISYSSFSLIDDVPRRSTKHCDRVSVCISVCPLAYLKITCANFLNFFVHDTCKLESDVDRVELFDWLWYFSMTFQRRRNFFSIPTSNFSTTRRNFQSLLYMLFLLSLQKGAGPRSNTLWPGPRPTSVPSFILIHPTVWPQYTNVTDRTGHTTVR